MPREVLEKLFTKEAISTKVGGTGLGTKIVKDVVDVHGGQITVDSKEGVGTTFHIRLPIRDR
jgi:signal transduction histidine kinase